MLLLLTSPQTPPVLSTGALFPQSPAVISINMCDSFHFYINLGLFPASFCVCFFCFLSLDCRLAVVRFGFLSRNVALQLHTEQFFCPFLVCNPYLKEGVNVKFLIVLKKRLSSKCICKNI